MQLYVIAIALPVLILGCANPQLLLHNPGTLVLKKGDQTVELREGAELALWWSVDGGSESTRSMVDGESRLAKVQIVEANEAYVRLKSVNWNKRGDLPAAYIAAKDLQLTLQSGGYKKPLVSVPIDQIEKIILYGSYARTGPGPGFSLSQSGKWMVVGAAVGFAFPLALELDVFSDDEKHGMSPDDEEFELPPETFGWRPRPLEHWPIHFISIFS